MGRILSELISVANLYNFDPGYCLSRSAEGANKMRAMRRKELRRSIEVTFGKAVGRRRICASARGFKADDTEVKLKRVPERQRNVTGGGERP